MKVQNILIIILIIIIIFLLVKSSAKKNYDNETIYPFKSSEIPVEAYVVRKRDFMSTMTLNGVVNAYNDIELFSEVNGKILSVNCLEGERVRSNEILVEINDEEYKIAYEKAKEIEDQKLAEYGLLIINEKNNYSDISWQHLDTLLNEVSDNQEITDAFDILKNADRKKMLSSRIGLTSARLDVKKAKLDLKNTTVRAPFKGYISNIYKNKHERILSGDKLLRIVSLDTLYIEVGILETELSLVKIGQQVRVHFPGFPDKVFQGKVRTISPVINAEDGTCTVKIEVINKGTIIKPGMFCSINITTNTMKDRILIPKQAVLSRENKKVVFTYNKGKSNWHYIETGVENDQYLEVLKGIELSDTVIISGHHNIAHKANVEISDIKEDL
jgi:multidrug efflux pump subunit AcrA (membrane-fusion protein)